MANFAIAASNATIEKAGEIMEMYAHAGDKKEDTFLRILAIAEAESTKGTHPELLENLDAVEKTIGTLVRQINGIVAGQDNIVLELKEQVNKANEEKEESTKKANQKMEKAEEMLSEARKMAEKAENDRIRDLKEIETYKIIADEKTARNAFLEKRVTALEKDLEDYKTLQEKTRELEMQLIKMQAQLDLEKEKVAFYKENKTV